MQHEAATEGGAGPPHQAATPSEVASLTEPEARALFSYYRFIETDGQPTCPKCKTQNIFEFKNRPLFGCSEKNCQHRFSLTSGTDFKHRKLSYKNILLIAAELNVSNQGISMREIKRRIRSIRHYKTVFLWAMKLRHALKRRQDSFTFGGEVEIDGVEVGGYIRPKNTRKQKSDHFKSALSR